jgi:hypothetical protein
MRARHLRVCSIPAGHQLFVSVFVGSGCHGGWMPLTANDGSAMTRDKPRAAPVRPGLRGQKAAKGETENQILGLEETEGDAYLALDDKA